MEKNAGDEIDYYLSINQVHQSDLGLIRQWENLWLAFDNQKIWVKGFEKEQLDLLALKSIPFKTLYYTKENKLFKLGSLLPEGPVPNLSWITIAKALPLQLPAFNFNFFGIQERISITLKQCTDEQVCIAMITSVSSLASYITSAPEVRLQALNWTIINQDQVLLLGTPLLPIIGQAYWYQQDFLLPAGYDFNLTLLRGVLNDRINPQRKHWVVWNTDGSYFLVKKTDVQALSLSSFRLSAAIFSLLNQ